MIGNWLKTKLRLPDAPDPKPDLSRSHAIIRDMQRVARESLIPVESTDPVSLIIRGEWDQPRRAGKGNGSAR